MENILFMVFGLLIAGLIVAVLLKLAARWAAKHELDFGSAYATGLILVLVNFVIKLLIGMAVGSVSTSDESQMIAELMTITVYFIAQTTIISLRHSIPFGRSLLVSLLMIVIGFVIAVAIYLALGMFRG